jgi:cyclophilin family peptidyl-prolyl cis-trans isomerase
MANRTATIQTNKGTIKFELLEEDAPKTTENFRLLAERGYYDGVIFHRCIQGFMIQGGDPDGTGRGGQSAWGGKFADEINPSSEVYKRGYKAGTVAMANAGPNTNGSQFFIMHVDYPLPPSYTIFGRVTEGQDIVDAIATSETDRSDKPTSDVKMEKVSVASISPPDEVGAGRGRDLTVARSGLSQRQSFSQPSPPRAKAHRARGPQR